MGCSVHSRDEDAGNEDARRHGEERVKWKWIPGDEDKTRGVGWMMRKKMNFDEEEGKDRSEEFRRRVKTIRRKVARWYL